MTQNKSQSIFVLAVMAMLLLLLVLFVFVLQPTFNELREQKNSVAQLETEADLLKRALSNKKDKEKLPDETQIALPLWDNTEQMVVSMKEIGAKTNAKLSSISFSATDSNSIQTLVGSKDPLFPSVKELNVQTVVQGSYNEIRSWLVELQKLPRIVVVHSVKYSLSVSGETAAEISFTGYYDPSYGYLLDNPVLPAVNEQ